MIRNVPAGGGGGGGEPTGPAGGSLAGEYPNPTLKAGSVALAALAAAVAARLTAEPEYLALEAINAGLAAAGAPWGEPRAGIDQFGVAHCRGALKPSVELAAKSILFTLPPSCRPETQRSFVLSVNLATTTVNVIVKPTGEVEVLSVVKATYVLDLSAITFPSKG